MAKILEKNIKICSSFSRQIIHSVHFGAGTFFAWCGAVRCQAQNFFHWCGAVRCWTKKNLLGAHRCRTAPVLAPHRCAPKIWNPAHYRENMDFSGLLIASIEKFRLLPNGNKMMSDISLRTSRNEKCLPLTINIVNELVLIFRLENE